MYGYGFTSDNYTFAAAGGGYLVDDYSPAVAFSVRKISSTATNCIRVRRSSDSSEQDIGFSGDDLDTASLESFCSGTDGFIAKWYDQSGSNDALMTTAASQPKIVSSGTTLTDPDNGSSAMLFDSTNDYFDLTSTLDSSGNPDQTEAVVYNRASTGIFTLGLGKVGASTPYASFWYSNNVNYSSMWGASGKHFGTQTATGDFLHFTFSESVGNTVDCYRNDSALTQVTLYGHTGSYTYDCVGRRQAQYMNGYMQELIWWGANESSNRTDIQDNINGYYSIY